MIKNVVTVTKFTLGITKGFKPFVFVSHKINLKLRMTMLCTYIHTIPGNERRHLESVRIFLGLECF